jgi:hypothetical protein
MANATLTGWIGNKADAPVELEITDDLAREFMASNRYDPEWPVYPPMTMWLAEEAGRNIAWDPAAKGNLDALDALYLRVRAIEKAEAVK